MIKPLLVLLLVFSVHALALACDACGCSVMGQPTGLLTEYKRNYLSLGWNRAGYSSAPGVGEGSVDVFQSFDISFQYYLSGRWRAGLYQAYRYNTREVNQVTQSVQGFADTHLTTDYTFFRKTSSDAFEVYLDIGAGLSLPTGKYDAHIHEHDLPENFNPGNGSLGVSLQQTNSVSYRSIGMVLKNSWTHYAETSAGYDFGDQWAGNLLVFYSQSLDSLISFVPMAGIEMENTMADHHPNGTEVHGTGGKGAFFSAGCQVKMKNWLCTFQYLLPLSNHFSDGEVEAGNRMNVQLTHLF